MGETSNATPTVSVQGAFIGRERETVED